MELSSSNVKKILIFSQKKAFLTFPKREPLFSPSSKNKKIIHLDKNFYISGNGNPEKISCAFSKESFFYISGTGNSQKNFLYFRK